MKREDFISLFPLEGRITEDIIKNSDVNDSYNCIGTNTLKAALGEKVVRELHPSMWGNSIGSICSRDYSWEVNITTKESVFMMAVSQPQDVTFIVDYSWD